MRTKTPGEETEKEHQLMNELMKQQKQLKLMCYKVEIVMSTEAWYFLHGTTNGVCNLTYFLSLLSGMSVTEVSKTKRGLGYALHLGQVDGSMLSLAKEWNIGRKSVSRLLEDFSQRGLIRVDSNPITTIIDMVCVKSWMMDGRLTENPTYQQMVKAYEGVRIYLFNGQRLETLRKSSTKAKKSKNKPAPTAQSALFISGNKGQTAEPVCAAESPASPPMADAYDANSQTEDILPTVHDKDIFPDGNTPYKQA